MQIVRGPYQTRHIPFNLLLVSAPWAQALVSLRSKSLVWKRMKKKSKMT